MNRHNLRYRRKFSHLIEQNFNKTDETDIINFIKDKYKELEDYTHLEDINKLKKGIPICYIDLHIENIHNGIIVSIRNNDKGIGHLVTLREKYKRTHWDINTKKYYVFVLKVPDKSKNKNKKNNPLIDLALSFINKNAELFEPLSKNETI